MRLKDLLRERGIEFRAIDVAADPQALADMQEKTGKSHVPQIFVGDRYIGGYGEFMLLDAIGEFDLMMGKKPAPKPAAGPAVYDLIIIGGGPAGLTAAVYAARKNLKTVVVADVLGGQPLTTWGVENYMGYQYITGPELMEKFEEQARQFDITLETGAPVTDLVLDGAMKKVSIADGRTLTARTVIIATGKKSRHLGIPGEKEFAGCGISYCATCDGPVFAGQAVMIAGGGNSAMQAALEMEAMCPEVHLVSLTKLTGDEVLVDKVQASQRIIKHILWHPVEIKGDKCVQSVVIEPVGGGESRELAVKAVFIEVGLEPNSSFAVDVVELNRDKEIVVDCDCRTGVQGVFAAGDVTQVRDKQIVVAAGEGAKAALSAHEFLMGQR